MARIHEREANVREAEHDLRGALLDIIKKHDLTDAEALRVVASVMGDHVASFAKYAIPHRTTRRRRQARRSRMTTDKSIGAFILGAVRVAPIKLSTLMTWGESLSFHRANVSRAVTELQQRGHLNVAEDARDAVVSAKR